MNPAGIDYLLRLAGLSLSFVGFSAIVVTVRRALGGELSEGHVRLVRLYIETGLAVTALSMVPTLLSFLGLSEPAMWRVASVAAGSLLTLLMIVQFRRRRRVEGHFPPWVVGIYLTSVVAVLSLWLNAAGIPNGPVMAPYAVSLTWSLFVSGYIFLHTLDLFLRSSSSGSKETHGA
jgi:xanthine/uracil permease